VAERYDLPQRLAPWVPPIITELVVAIALIALAIGVRLAIEQSFQDVVPFVLIYPAIAAATLLAGLRCGAIVLIGCQLLTWYFVLPVKHSFRFAQDGNVISLLLATNAELLVLWLVSSYRKSAQANAEFEKQRAQLARENADRLKIFVAELHHRTRNIIAVVRSLSDNTLERSDSIEDFAAKFRLRLAALARAQGLLSHLAEDDRVAFDQLLSTEMAAYAGTGDDGARVAFEGPPGVRLQSSAVQTLALAIHELATNAVKYGALAQPRAHLSVCWRVEPAAGEGSRLHVDWRESGVVMPEGTGAAFPSGYGRELIERVLPYQLGAQTTYELGRDGVRCTIALLAGKPATSIGADEGVKQRAAEAAL